jgi:5-methylcytosine-specific restriction endonuclease McrA
MRKPPIHFGKDNNRYNPDFHIIEKTLCNCGCGNYISYPKSRPKKFIWGHNTRIRTAEEKRNQIKLAYKIRKEYYDKIGRVSPLYKIIKKSKKYTDWRTSIFQRDDYTCQECKTRGFEIQAHHKKPFSFIYRQVINIGDALDTSFEKAMIYEPLWDLDNGITLCKDCHKKLHLKEGIINQYTFKSSSYLLA